MTGESGKSCAYYYCATAVLVESYVMGIIVIAEYEDVVSSTADRQRELLKNERN